MVPMPRSFLWRWLMSRLAQARTQRALASLDERLLRDIGLTRDGLPASGPDWWG